MMATTRLSTAAVLHVVQRAHGGFRHRQTQRPFFIAGFQKLIPRVRDDGVLGARAFFTGEHQRLIGHHTNLRHHRLRSARNGHELLGHARHFAIVAAAADVKQTGGVLHARGFHNRHPMPPLGPVHFFFGEIPLRNHIEDKHRGVVCSMRFHQMILISRIRLGHVAIERGFLIRSKNCGHRSNRYERKNWEQSIHNVPRD
jgi:hypothetical protein